MKQGTERLTKISRGEDAMSKQTVNLKYFSEYSFTPLVDTPPAVDKHQLDVDIERLRHGARKLTIDVHLQKGVTADMMALSVL